MWRHFPHHSHAICGEISDFYTSVTRRNLKLLHMWRKFRFLHICHVERCEITPHVEKFQNSPHLSCIEIWNFSTWQIFSPRIYPWDPWQIWGMYTVMVNLWIERRQPSRRIIAMSKLLFSMGVPLKAQNRKLPTWPKSGYECLIVHSEMC